MLSNTSSLRSLLWVKMWDWGLSCTRGLYHVPASGLCLLRGRRRRCSCSERFLREMCCINPTNCAPEALFLWTARPAAEQARLQLPVLCFNSLKMELTQDGSSEKAAREAEQ